MTRITITLDDGRKILALKGRNLSGFDTLSISDRQALKTGWAPPQIPGFGSWMSLHGRPGMVCFETGEHAAASN